MAFGSSWHILSGFKEQVQMLESVPTGPLGDAVFNTTRPSIADSTWYLFEVSHEHALCARLIADDQAVPINIPFPALSDFLTSLSPTYRRHNRAVQSYLKKKLVESREKIKAIGPESAVDLADNTLDMMVARETRAEDWMPDNEMMVEVLQCGSETAYRPN
jgi:hypothetical protein